MLLCTCQKKIMINIQNPGTMKQFLSISLILILFISCNSSDNENNNESRDTFADIENAALESDEPEEIKETVVTQEDIDKLWSQSFSGLLDDEYIIFMQLFYDEDNKIRGYYFYESSGLNMSLKGKRTSSGFILDEFNSKDKNIATFEGDYKNGVFSGRWVKADGSKELTFNLEDFNFTSNCNTVKISEEEMEIPEESFAEAKYPVYKCDNKTLEKRLNFYYSESLTGISLEELQEQAERNKETGMPDGFSGFYYSIDYNENCILSISTSVETVGAHMFYDFDTYNIDLHTGLDLAIWDMIKEEKIPDLVKLCNKFLQENIKAAIKKNDPDGEGGLQDMLSDSEFTIGHLNNFSFSEKGINFEYYFGFAHVDKAWEPDGYITLHFSDLKDFVKPKGPLHFVLE